VARAPLAARTAPIESGPAPAPRAEAVASPSPAPAGPTLPPAVPLPPVAPPAGTVAAAPPASPPGDQPTDEQELLGQALRQLQAAHDAKAALATLDAYAARFPVGALAPEASRLRTFALLALGRKSAALAELDRQSWVGLPDAEERRVLRGELRAGAGRWQAAFADFDAVVQAHANERASAVADDARAGEGVERALWGRASARSRLGDESGARADLRAYLERFPRGRFAAEATRLLGGRR
jgi:TolA-binding protein